MAEMLDSATDKYRQGSSDSRKSSELVPLPILADYFTRTSSYGETERQIQDIFNLDELSDPSLWGMQISESSPEFLFRSNGRVFQAMNFLPKILKLLERTYEDLPADKQNSPEGIEIQQVILTDEGDQFSSTERIIDLLQSIQQIYRNIAEIHGVKGANIAVVGMDSGSEKSFDFLGIAEFVKELRETLREVYNMITFHRQNITLKNLQVAGESIGIIAEIAKLEKNGGITEAEASRMRMSLYSAMEKFANTGAYTPDMNESVQPPAIAMRPQPRLLTGPVEELVRNSREMVDDHVEAPADIGGDLQADSSGSDSDDFTAAELAAAARLLRKASSKVSLPKKTQRSSRKKPTN